jgi:hypothetical protein
MCEWFSFYEAQKNVLSTLLVKKTIWILCYCEVIPTKEIVTICHMREGAKGFFGQIHKM